VESAPEPRNELGSRLVHGVLNLLGIARKPDRAPGGDRLKVGDIADSTGVAIGDGARAEVQIHYHYEYIERPAAGTPYLAPALPPHHVPREAELAELRALLLGGERLAAVVALRGMGGVGKTTLAIALCHARSTLEAFPDGILWTTFGPQPDLLSAQSAWGRELGCDLTGLPDAEARAARLRSLLHDKRCLLVIDDVWDAACLPPMAVGGPQCSTLVTTRERKIAQKVGEAYDLDVLKPEQALTMLEGWASGIADEEKATAEELARRLGHLPLALALAGAQIQDGETWAGLLTVFRDVQGGEDVTWLDLDDPQARDESLALTFGLSVDRLSEALQGQFARFGVFAAGREAPFDAPAAAAVWQTPPDRAEKALRRLARAALLEREGDCYVLHLLVGDYARSRLDETSRKEAEARHAVYYLGVMQRSAADWQAAEAALPQVRAAQRRAAGDADGLYAWAAAAKEFFHKRGYWTTSMAWLAEARAAAQVTGKRDYEGRCESELGWLCLSSGKLDEALAHYQAGLTIAQEVGDACLAAQALNRIGYVHFQRGALDEALAQFRACLDMVRQIGDKSGEADSHHLIGMIHQRRGELDEALAHYQASLDIRKEAVNQRMEAVTRHNMGRIYLDRGEQRQALAHYQASLDISRQIGDRMSEATILTSIGGIHEQLGELDEALAQYQAGLVTQRESGSQDYVAYSLNSIGRIYLRQCKPHEALEQFQTGLAIFRQVGDQVGEAKSLHSLGRAYEALGLLADAESALAEALALCEAIHLPEAAEVRQDLERVRNQTRSDD
jgi:tetratricopeptide (TPR) repeat protein